IGNNPPLPEFVKTAITSCQFSVTLLIEPGLFHYEMGWPNMLRWSANLGPLNAEFRGGFIFRVSTTEIVQGTSFLARARIDINLEAGFGFFGVRIRASADVAFGARYIGLITFVRPLENS